MQTSTPDSHGRRERKKQATRRALQQAVGGQVIVDERRADSGPVG